MKCAMNCAMKCPTKCAMTCARNPVGSPMRMLLPAVLVLLAACSRSEAPAPSARVAARVNGDAISVRDIDGLVYQAGALPSAPVDHPLGTPVGATPGHAPLQPEALRAL